MREEYAFTVQDVTTQMRELAAERPEYVYRPVREGELCSYVTGADGQGCIVGQAVMRLGVPRERLAALEGDDTGPVSAKLLMKELLGEQVERTDEAAWISTVQAEQDHGRPWGEAVAAAGESLRRFAGLNS